MSSERIRTVHSILVPLLQPHSESTRRLRVSRSIIGDCQLCGVFGRRGGRNVAVHWVLLAGFSKYSVAAFGEVNEGHTSLLAMSW